VYDNSKASSLYEFRRNLLATELIITAGRSPPHGTAVKCLHTQGSRFAIENSVARPYQRKIKPN